MDKKCEHKNTHKGYGFGEFLGFRGMGTYEVCEDCNKVLYWSDDLESNFIDEIKHNRKRRKKLGLRR